MRNDIPKALRETLAMLEHQQWAYWARAVMSEVSLERQERWKKYLVPYQELSEDVKDFDRKWADKVLTTVRGALEQARKEGYMAGRKEVFDTLGFELITGTALMQCGHPVACVHQNDEGAAYCAWCAALEQARVEEREQCARIAMATFNPKQPEDADYDWGYNDAKRDIAAAIHNADLEVE